MKVVLLKDVQKVGKKYEAKEVSDGYALNYLIPNGAAEVATEKTMKKVELARTRDAEERKVMEDLLLMNLKEIDGVKIEMKEKANEKGHLFAGIHKNELIPEIKKQTRIDISADFIDLDAPIKAVGEYEIPVKVKDRVVKFKLVVSAA